MRSAEGYGDAVIWLAVPIVTALGAWVVAGRAVALRRELDLTSAAIAECRRELDEARRRLTPDGAEGSKRASLDSAVSQP